MNFIDKSAALTVVSCLLYACGTSEPTPTNNTTAGDTEATLDNLQSPPLDTSKLGTLYGESATLRVLLTDAPIDADNVFVTFCGVHVAARSALSGASTVDAGAAGDAGAAETEAEYASGDAGAGTWISLGDDCQTYDLLALRNGISTELGLQALPPGAYGQIRLMLTEASIVVGGETKPLTIPSGVQSGIKVGHGFVLEAGMLTTLALDFDAARSIHETPGMGYVMRPVIELLGERKESLTEAVAHDSKHDAGVPPARDAGARESASHASARPELDPSSWHAGNKGASSK
jgi:hypothetical protein